MDNELEINSRAGSQIVPPIETFGSQLAEFLGFIGLPKDNILVPFERRGPVLTNLPIVLENLSDEQKSASSYISKFAAACAVGLFDSALNYLWNETINNLRTKVVRFDLAYFFDSVASESNPRSKLQNETDLQKLEDWILISGCRKTGIISENGFRHLDYVRNMRNHASAAHPNQNEITGLQLISWLETCILEVLAKEPAGPAIEVRKLLHSLRNQILTCDDVPPIEAALPSLPDDLADSLLRSVFGMYSDVQIDVRVRDNVKLAAKPIWLNGSNEARVDAGLKQALLAANGDVARARLAREFIEIVDGQDFLTKEILTTEMSRVLDNLAAAHYGMNNFYTEPGPARLLRRLVPPNGLVPKSVLRNFVKTVTMCRIGNGYGVSWGAKEHYDDLIGRFSDDHIHVFVNVVNDQEVVSRLQFQSCFSRYQELASTLETRAVNPRLKEMLSFVKDYPPENLINIAKDSTYLRMRETLQV